MERRALSTPFLYKLLMRDTKQEVLRFWFDEIEPIQWFQKNALFDDEIRERFHCTYDMARKDLCSSWNKDADGVLALCIVLDQFPRNMFRDTPKAYETDSKALAIANDAISKGLDQILSPEKRRFVYMPFMHSEKLEDQKKCVELFDGAKIDDPLSYEYAVKHLRVVEEFGRFPHRNSILGRENTDAEIVFLKQTDSVF